MKNNNRDIDLRTERLTIERAEGWRDWVRIIPTIRFDADWDVQIVPPFGGAAARFMVNKNDMGISVYLDCNDALGSMGKPYWEAYPMGEEGDTARFFMPEAEKLIDAIRHEFARREQHEK